MSDTHPLIIRAAVAEAVASRFIGRAFAWGVADCAVMAHEVLTGFGLTSPWPKSRGYGTERGARKAMKRLGYTGIDDALDRLGLERIAPAFALPGDLLGFESSSPAFGVALGVTLSAGKCCAFIDDTSIGFIAVVGWAHFAKTAWRVI